MAFSSCACSGSSLFASERDVLRHTQLVEGALIQTKKAAHKEPVSHTVWDMTEQIVHIGTDGDCLLHRHVGQRNAT